MIVAKAAVGIYDSEIIICREGKEVQTIAATISQSSTPKFLEILKRVKMRIATTMQTKGKSVTFRMSSVDP